MYHSSYPDDYLAALAHQIRALTGRPVWCVFDNTARGAATVNALDLVERLRSSRSRPAARRNTSSQTRSQSQS
jgi:uncharacterized protein YecE (DUF72 family)